MNFERIPAVPSSPPVQRSKKMKCGVFCRFAVGGDCSTLGVMMKFITVIPIAAIAEIFKTQFARGSVRRSFGFSHRDCSALLKRTAAALCAVICEGSALAGETEIDDARASVVEVVQTAPLPAIPHRTPDHSRTQFSYDAECPSEQIASDGSMSFGSAFNMPEMHDGALPPGFLMSEGQIPTLSYPPVFVHSRKTLPPSRRTAEIWVQLPENSETKVSINFVEFPPEGTFRIFRTHLQVPDEQKRYYLSARTWQDNQWKSLAANSLDDATAVIPDRIRGTYYVDLTPGQRAVVEFTESHATNVHDEMTALVDQ